MDISRIKITRVNGIYNYDIPIANNTLILVGENGTGKSTVLSILNLIISRQWEKITEYKFKEIEIDISERTFKFTKKDIQFFVDEESIYSRGRKAAKAEFYIRKELNRNSLPIEDILSKDKLFEQFREELRYKYKILISYDGLRDILHKFETQLSIDFQNSVSDIDNFIKKNIKSKVIYLPTYRRIERELSSILPNFDRNYDRSYRTHSSDHELGLLKNRTSPQRLLELVEFGMADVNAIITESLSDLEESFRTGMKKLMSDYLQDIILDKHKNFNKTFLNDIKPRYLEKMLQRIDNETLSDTIKSRITEILQSTVNDEGNSDSDLMLSYFITMLMSFHEEQTKEERKIERLIATCNKYLVRKSVIYNSISFEINIFHTDEKGEKISNEPIPFKALSSGEKQIVSLFTHLILGDDKDYIIIIDEPELSLSVKWQRYFLEDIRNAEKCKGLFSVTHSPFVFENSLDEFARSITEFMESSHEFR